MSLADEIQKLQDLHGRGVLTDEEFARAKATVLAGPPAGGTADPAALDTHLRQIQQQNELERLDREWKLEREKYMICGRYGSHIPNEGWNLVGALVIGGFGIAWTMGAASMDAPAIFPIFGIVFVVLGVGQCINGFFKAGEYDEAQRRYQQRRAKLQEKNRSGRLK